MVYTHRIAELLKEFALSYPVHYIVGDVFPQHSSHRFLISLKRSFQCFATSPCTTCLICQQKWLFYISRWEQCLRWWYATQVSNTRTLSRGEEIFKAACGWTAFLLDEQLSFQELLHVLQRKLQWCDDYLLAPYVILMLYLCYGVM